MERETAGEGSISKRSLEVKTAVSGIEIRSKGREWIVDTYDVITVLSRIYDLGDYIHIILYARTEKINCARSGPFSQIRSQI